MPIASAPAADFLRGKIAPASNLSVVSACFTIIATFRRRVASGLQSGRSFVIPKRSAQAHEQSDFELVPWLVIK